MTCLERNFEEINIFGDFLPFYVWFTLSNINTCLGETRQLDALADYRVSTAYFMVVSRLVITLLSKIMLQQGQECWIVGLV